MMGRDIPSVTLTSDSEPFFAASTQGTFSIPACDDCGKTHWYPRPLCPHCFGERINWKPASGRGRIHTFSVMRRVPQPYAVAYVELAEGPLMLTNLVDCDLDAIRIDQPVELVFKPNADGLNVPMFRPA